MQVATQNQSNINTTFSTFSQRFYTSDISRHHAFMGVFGDVKLHLHCDTRLSSRFMFCSVSNFTKCSFRHFYVLAQNPQRDSHLQSPLPVSLFFNRVYRSCYLLVCLAFCHALFVLLLIQSHLWKHHLFSSLTDLIS